MPQLQKQISGFFLLLIASGCTMGNRHEEPQTSEEVVLRAAETWGGEERLDELRGMRVEVIYEDHDYLVTHEIERPNRVRTTGGDQYVSLFDGERAGFSHRIDGDGNEVGPSLVGPEEAKDWELEIAWIFPAFFDHAAELLGKRDFEGDSAYLLRVQLPLGATVDYYVDSEAFTTVRVEATVTIREETYTMGRIYADYQSMDGILYPATMLFYFGDQEPQTATIDVVEFGVSFPEGHFELPEGLVAETPGEG